jgi:DNA-binding Lrp family transcriptional regulator
MGVFPDDSNRKIAREVGLSEKTVRDVRKRIRRGESPLPE